MLPLLATKTFLSNLPLLTIAKIGVIIALMGSYKLSNMASSPNDINQERLDIAEHQAIIAGKRTYRILVKTNFKCSINPLQAATANRNLENKITRILKDHKNAPILPSNCIIDDAGVLSLEATRNAAISTATNNSSIPVN